jgi:AraC-like DNA-binding protein
MLYERIKKLGPLSDIIDCYWVVESDHTEVTRQKIIPDGFPEIIFHYGDPYRINISGSWETQSPELLAGQIRNHFMLENTGISGMIGIKFKPAGITRLFDIEMATFTDRVVDLNTILEKEFIPISEFLLSDKEYTDKVSSLDNFFGEMNPKNTENDLLISQIVEKIFESRGLISVSEITKLFDIGERKLERLFKKYVGLSPKFYCRIIRFNYIFEILQERKIKWSELAHLSGFYDQSHFISNFQEFTGEDPSAYFFEEDNLANFFLKRPVEQ